MSKNTAIFFIASATLLLAVPAGMQAQGRGRGGRGAPAQTPREAAPMDLTGYWTTVITEDWHERMLDAPRGDFGTGAPGAVAIPGGGFVGRGPNPSERGNIPYNVAGAQLAMKWDPAKDEAEGNQCRSYGAAGILRGPTHLHITWQDDYTLRMDADYGTQTRLFHFARSGSNGQMAKLEAPAGEPASWQGYSAAEWGDIMGGGPGWPRGGKLKAVTTHMKAGYYWKNGMPYSANAVMTEYFRVINLPDSGQWIVFSQMVEDPTYLRTPFIINYHFKKLPDGSKWNPTPCMAK
jgi:hypothetical protein